MRGRHYLGMCPHMSRSETLLPDIALYLVARSPQPQQNQFFAFIFCMGALFRMLNLFLILMPKFEVQVEFWQM